MKIIKTIFYLFNPHLLVRRFIFVYRKNKAIKKAILLSKSTDKNIHIIQVGNHFDVGTRHTLHKFNKNGRKNLRKITSKYEFDCKQSIIFTAKNGKAL
jgi:hypothetical protein